VVQKSEDRIDGDHLLAAKPKQEKCDDDGDGDDAKGDVEPQR